MVRSARVLLICDEEPLSMYLREKLIIDAGFEVSFESTSSGGITALKDNNFDIVLLKFYMPDLNNAELIRNLKKTDPNCLIIGIVDKADEQRSRESTKGEIYDFVTHPVDLDRLFLTIAKGVELRILMITNTKLVQSIREQNISLQRQNLLLAKRIEESTRNLSRLYEDLRSTYMRTIKVLAQAIDARDHYTHSHSENVAKYAVAIAEELRLSVKEIVFIREACELHDLGKIGVTDSILGKSSSLDEQEWIQIRRHPLIGAQILEPLTFLGTVVDLIKQHHENFDGSGYPERKKGEDILLGARIIRVADAYESMRSERSYRKIPLSKEEALLELKKNKGTQFDPKVVEAFLKIVDKV